MSSFQCVLARRLTPDRVLSFSKSSAVLPSLPYNPRQLALASGTRLGPWEILSAIGAGRMGKVYRT